jgi:hypothetical protein
METEAAFLPETEQLFDSYLTTAAQNRCFLFTPGRRAEYRQWILHPKAAITGSSRKERQEQHNNSNRAINSYELERGRLWRRSASSKPRRVVLSTDNMFEHIAEVHFELEHAQGDKTYGLVCERFYGVVREDVDFILARCVVCLVRYLPLYAAAYTNINNLE